MVRPQVLAESHDENERGVLEYPSHISLTFRCHSSPGDKDIPVHFNGPRIGTVVEVYRKSDLLPLLQTYADWELIHRRARRENIRHAYLEFHRI